MRFYYQNFIKISSGILLLSIAIFSQTTSKTTVENDDVNDRVKQLEAQVLAMQAELEKLKLAIGTNEKTENKTVAAVVEPKPEVKTAEVKSEVAKQDEKKSLGIDLGNVRLTPYGIIFFNAYGNSGGTNNADIPLWATQGDKGNVSASVRQTRFGVRIDAGNYKGAKIMGVLEADFFGGSPAIGIGENFGVVRVRLANVKFDWEKTSLLVGQDWIPFAPNSPVSLADAAIPQFAASGNPWARLPQVKVEHRWNKVVWQGAVLAPQTGDSNSTANFLLQPNSGASSNVPFFQSRISFNEGNWFSTGKKGNIGLSGHFGRSRTTSTSAPISEQDINSYGVAFDWNIPLHKRVMLIGETFYGRNLGGFQAGIFQNYNTDYAVRQNNLLTAMGVQGIATFGGWTQLGITPDFNKDKLSLYASIGFDDPNNNDLISFRTRDFRSRNLSWALDAIYKFTPQIQFGFEFRQLNTDFSISGRRRANHVNFAGSYSF